MDAILTGHVMLAELLKDAELANTSEDFPGMKAES